MITAWKMASIRFDSELTTFQGLRSALFATTQPLLRSNNSDARMRVLDFVMKAIGGAVRGVDFPT